jgi:protein phosphatase
MSTVVRKAGVTDTGRKRRRNEDAYVLAPPIFAVADGLGGAQAGEVASKLAATALEDTDHGQLRGEEGVAALIQEANRRVYERSHEDPSVSGMGTTITVALVEDDGVAIGHVGDSRAYLIRDGRMQQLTEDHSLVNELMKSGKLSAAEAEAHPQRSVITRALGTDPDVDVDTYSFETQPGDLFLLCSDGLTSMVGEETILEVLERNRRDLDHAARELVKAANRGGGEDNITVVAFEIGGAEDEDLEVTRPIPAQTEAAHDADEDTLDGLPSPAAGAGSTEPDRSAGAGSAGAGAGSDTMVVRPEDVEDVEVAEEPRADRLGPRLRLIWTIVLLLGLAVALVVWGLTR